MTVDILEKLLPRVGAVLADRYRVERVLGQGGFGVVFVAVQTNLDRKVAIKMMLPHAITDNMAVVRFQREIEAAKRLEHPHTVRIFDRGVSPEGLQYYVMEYVTGRALNDVLFQDHAFTPARTKKVAEQVLGSLGEAHEQGIVHRDLKPANIMLTSVFGQKDYVKVLDFGIAKFIAEGHHGDEAPTTRGLIGTPAYMSPEQAKGERVIDGRSDLYALGLIMCELLTGRPTVVGETAWSIVAQQATVDQPVALDAGVLSGPLGSIIYRATQKHREHRFGSAIEMLEALTEIALPAESGRTTWPPGTNSGLPRQPQPQTPIAVYPPSEPVYSAPSHPVYSPPSQPVSQPVYGPPSQPVFTPPSGDHTGPKGSPAEIVPPGTFTAGTVHLDHGGSTLSDGQLSGGSRSSVKLVVAGAAFVAVAAAMVMIINSGGGREATPSRTVTMPR
jgi:serine/threonine-protein kinase